MSSSPAPGGPRAALEAFFRERSLDPGRPALVGYSGGPDSTALLHLLVELGAGPLRAVHVDHGLRPAPEREAEFELVLSTCRGLGLPLSRAILRPGSVLARARREGCGVEAAARAFRMEAFAAILAEREVDTIYLAHNLDDRLETILMRLFGGAGSPGLRGLESRSERGRGPLPAAVLRPLLGTRKAELLAWLAARGIPWSADSSNAGEAYLRNRLRSRLLPALSEVFPGWERGLLLTADKARLDEEALAAAGAGLVFEESGRGTLSCPAEALLSAPSALAIRALVLAASRLFSARPRATSRRVSSRRVSSRRVSSRWAAAALAALGTPAGRHLGGGMLVRRSGERVELSLALDFPRPDGYFGSIEGLESGRIDLRSGGFRIEARWSRGEGAPGPLRGTFSFPLVVRCRKPGDSIALPSGSRSLDELFGEWGVPEAGRWTIPVLEDRDGIVAVLGGAAGWKDRYRHRPDGLPAGGREALSIQVKGA